MSFSSDAKAEMCRTRLENDSCVLAECYGALLFCSTFNSSEIRISTSSTEFISRLISGFKRAFRISFDSLPGPEVKGRFTLRITDPGKINTVFDRFGISSRHSISHHINLAVLEEDSSRPAFIRGAFLSGGTVNDPDKSFHIELSTSHRSVCREACSILSEMGFSPKTSERNNNSLLYFKQADSIADLLTTLGAPSAAMKVMTAKVEKEMRNTITRRVNCDTANADKIVFASQEQIDAIHRYASRFGLDSLPEALKATALLRITNPEASLADLALLSVPKVSKSCLSHRLKKIQELADGEANIEIEE